MAKESKRYGNCRVYSPQGELMFLCNRSRIDWYLKRNLLEITQRSPYIEARLKFQPNGLGYAKQEDFYFSPRMDKCVTCGTEEFDTLTRHHIVPTCYRKWMPVAYKSHNCYDVVKMCRSCHDDYEIEAQSLKFQIANELGVDIFKRVSKLSTIKGYANTLSSHYVKLPDDVFLKMYNTICDYLGKKHLCETDLERLMNMRYSEDPCYKTWGLECLEKIDDIDEFVMMWRKHFLEVAKPKYMPDGWQIDKGLKNKKNSLYNEGSN